MYERFYGFREKPFRIVPDPSCIFPSENHRNALAALQYGLMENSGFILLTGEIGSGKTTLVRYVLGRIEKAVHVAFIQNTNLMPADLIGMVLLEFGLPAAGSKTQDLKTLKGFLSEAFERKRRVLLIIDEAQNLCEEALEEARLLSNLQSHRQALMQIMLVGQSGLLEKLKKPSMLQLAQRVAVSYHLRALTLEETGSYIGFRIARSGGRPEIFSPEAVALVFELSAGIPRTINLACHAALVHAFAEGAATVAAHHVSQIRKDRLSICFHPAGGPTCEKTTSAAGDPPPGNGFDRRLEALEQQVRALQLLGEARHKQIHRLLLTSHQALMRRLNGRRSEQPETVAADSGAAPPPDRP